MPILERSRDPRLYYEIDDHTDPWKDAPWVLLQHGYARSTRFWYAWVPYLSRFCKVLRADLRGLGQSGKDFDLSKDLTVDSYLRDFNDLLDHLGIESIHYCGEMSAGILGMAYAATFPERVRTLTVVSSPVYMTEEDKKSALQGHSSRVEMLKKMGSRAWLQASNAGRRFPADADPAMLAWTLDEMGKSDADVLAAYFEWVSVGDATPYLAKIKVPMLGLYPQGGVIIKEEHLQVLRKHVPAIRIVRVPSPSQALHITAPAFCAQEVLQFIAQHEGIVCHE